MLQLPENFVVPEKRPKRAPRPIDFDVFQDEQRPAVEEIIAYIEGESPHRMMVLTGYAGTGKSFVVGKLQDWILYAKKMKVAVSAPTNKAVQVCKDMCEIVDNRLTFATIHSLLGLKESYDRQGRAIFVPDTNEPASLESFQVLFLDEASMLDDDLFRMIEPFVEDGLKIIFIGDPAQIPPVNRIDCIPFIKKHQLKYKIGVCELTKIRRQEAGNPLLGFATEIREQRFNETFEYEYDVQLTNGMGLVPIYKSAKDVIYQICDTYFSNSIFSDYPDFMKVVSWTNKVGNAVNTRIRELVYKDRLAYERKKDPDYKLPMLLPEEKMLADKPIFEGRQIVMTTNTEFVVKNYEVKETKYVAEVAGHIIAREVFKYYETEVEVMTIKGLRRFRIMIVHEDSAETYKTAQQMTEMYGQQMNHTSLRGAAWGTHYALKKFFAAVKYNYAITAHKAQGSSYENCMMIEWNMLESGKHEEANRIRYVAATRARKHLFIVK